MNANSRVLIRMFLVLTLAAMAITLAAAQASSIVVSGDLDNKPATRGPDLDKAEIAIGSQLLFTIRTPAAGFTVAERARILDIRLTEIISNVRMDPGNFRLDQVRGKPTLYVGDYRLVTVYPRDAEAADCTDQELAERWLAGLREKLPLVAPEAAVKAPVTYQVGVGGVMLFRLRDPNGFDTLRARGAAVEARLVPVVSSDGLPAIEVQPVAEGHAIYAGDQQVVTATKLDAEIAGLPDSEALAKAWAARLSDALPLIKAGLPDTQD